jgi:hypothetical protein
VVRLVHERPHDLLCWDDGGTAGERQEQHQQGSVQGTQMAISAQFESQEDAAKMTLTTRSQTLSDRAMALHTHGVMCLQGLKARGHKASWPAYWGLLYTWLPHVTHSGPMSTAWMQAIFAAVG